MRRNFMAELIGTFALVFCGAGAMIVDQVSGGVVTHVGIGMTFGLIVTVMIYSVGSVSGAHLNPAVSIGFVIAGKMPLGKMYYYLIAQCVGAVLASILLFIMFPNASTMGETVPSGTLWQAFVMELVITFFLMFVIINVATGSKEEGILAGIAIGMTVMLAAIFAGPITGAGMNPARSLGPALMIGDLSYMWLYTLAPILGSALAVGAWRSIKPQS